MARVARSGEAFPPSAIVERTLHGRVEWPAGLLILGDNITTDHISPAGFYPNGEYMPHPQTKQQQHVEYRIKELADSAAKKLGISRRQFLEGTGGLAASFIAINEAFGKPFFKVSPVEMYEPAAYADRL
jgi:aconitase A